jgi:quercetin dioxygenase-like cupin family protein
MITIKSILTKLFLVKEIRSKEGVLHFERWRLLSTGLFSVYIHRIFKSDEDANEHSHPWNFLSFILKGGYIEQRNGKGKIMTPGNYMMMGVNEYHKITVIKPTTTLVITGPRICNWGYKTEHGHVNSAIYRLNKRYGLKN